MFSSASFSTRSFDPRSWRFEVTATIPGSGGDDDDYEYSDFTTAERRARRLRVQNNNAIANMIVALIVSGVLK